MVRDVEGSGLVLAGTKNDPHRPDAWARGGIETAEIVAARTDKSIGFLIDHVYCIGCAENLVTEV